MIAAVLTTGHAGPGESDVTGSFVSLAIVAPSGFVDTSPLHSGGPVDDHMQVVYSAVFWVSIVVGLFTSLLILYSFVRFRRRSDDDEPKQVHGNAKLELAWTAIPLVILVSLFFLSAANMNFIATAPAGAMKVGVLGQRYAWTFSYTNQLTGAGRPAHSINTMYVPADAPVQLDITSSDVNHSFYVPALAGQMNALPGQHNELWLQARIGHYYGQCTELCGDGHANMLLDVVALPHAQFDSCMAKLRAGRGPCPAGGS